MRIPLRTLTPVLATLAAFSATSAPLAASAAVLRVLSADDRGVTIQVGAEDWSLAAPDAVTGRASIVGVPAARSIAIPGRALLPTYGGLLAIPADARPSIRVLSRGAETTRDGVRLKVAGRPGFRPDPGGGLATPVTEQVDPIVDGAWPPEEALLGAPTSFRGRRLVSFEVRPFRYDEGASRLTAVAGYTVRVEFNRPSGSRALATAGHRPDPGMDAALATSVLNFEQARPWREAPAGAAGSDRLFASPSAARAFDESDPEVRVMVDSTGLYQLPFDLLAPMGYPGNVPIAQVAVHRHEFLEGQNPSYATIDIPVEVDDVNGSGTFDSGDLIWMYARTWAERSGASQYQRWWGDADAVFVTRNAAGGARIPVRDGWRGATGLTPLASYPLKTHYERNNAIIMPNVWVPADTVVDVFHWTSFAFYYDRPDTILFDVNTPDTSRSASFTINWVGRVLQTHYEWASVRKEVSTPGDPGRLTTLADSVSWNGKRPFTTNATVFGSALSAGRTNALRIWGRDSRPEVAPAPERDDAGLNWFEVTYWRSFRALKGVLNFNSGDGAGVFQVHADRFLADSVRLYDVTNPDQPVRLVLDEAHVQRASEVSFDFQDSTATGVRRSYVAAAVSYGDPDYGPRTPPASQFSAVTRRNLHAALPPDYLFIVPEAFLPAIQPLVDLRTSQGLHVLVAPTEAIYDEFNGGRHSGAAIQRFVRYAYTNWDSRFVLLFGDGGIDPQRHSARSGVDWVPTLPIPGPVSGSAEGFEIVPGDPAYGCLTGNCNPQGFGPILVEMMIGRLPVNSLTDANNVVAKLVAYETLAGDQDWRRRLLLTSDDAFSGDSFFGGGTAPATCYGHMDAEEHFVGLNTKCASIVNRDAGLALTSAELFNLRYYLASEGWTYNPPADTCRPDRSATMGRTHASVTPQLLAKLNAGVLWWNFQGHANEYVLTHENLFVNAGDQASSDDKFMYANPGKPFLFSAFSCHANNFGRNSGGPGTPLGGCLGEDMVVWPQGGAIASWASVCYEVVPRDDSTHINVEMARSLFADPPVDEFVPGDRGARVVIGEAFQAAMQRYVPTGGQYYGEQGIALSYTLLGDPATRMSVGYPQPFISANGIPVVEGTPVRVHTSGDTVRFVADLVSAERLDSLGVFENLGAGDVPVSAAAYTVTPPFPDTAGGGTFGGRRFRVVYRTQPPAHDATYLFRVRDRNGLQTDFTATMLLRSTLRVDGVPIQDGDDVSPRANLSILVVSPKPLNPATDLVLTINNQPQAFTPAAAPGDASGREWVLTWAHDDYLVGSYGLELNVAGGVVLSHTFDVSTAVGDLFVEGLLAFPNPFDALGTRFSFALKGSDPADVKIDIYTVSGRRLNSLIHRDLAPGYHQLAWDGNDAEGSALANGVYLYRLSAVTPSGKHVDQLGRLVKLRRPRRVEVETTP